MIPQGRSFVEVVTAEHPEVLEVWGPVVTDSSITLIYAPRGVGKSYVTLGLAHSIATGTKFLKWKCLKQKVVMVDGEQVLRAVTIRTRKVEPSGSVQVRGNDIKFYTEEDTGGTMWNMSDPQHQLLYEQAIGNYRVVIFDNYQNCTAPVHERDNQFTIWERVAPWLKKLRAMGKAIILVDHTNKAGDADGTMKKQNLANTVISLYLRERTPTGMMIDLTFEKTRDAFGRDVEPMVVEVVNYDDGSKEGAIRFLYHDMEKEQIRRVSVLVEQKVSTRDIANALDIGISEAAELVSKVKQLREVSNEPTDF